MFKYRYTACAPLHSGAHARAGHSDRRRVRQILRRRQRQGGHAVRARVVRASIHSSIHSFIHSFNHSFNPKDYKPPPPIFFCNTRFVCIKPPLTATNARVYHLGAHSLFTPTQLRALTRLFYHSQPIKKHVFPLGQALKLSENVLLCVNRRP